MPSSPSSFRTPRLFARRRPLRRLAAEEVDILVRQRQIRNRFDMVGVDVCAVPRQDVRELHAPRPPVRPSRRNRCRLRSSDRPCRRRRCRGRSSLRCRTSCRCPGPASGRRPGSRRSRDRRRRRCPCPKYRSGRANRCRGPCPGYGRVLPESYPDQVCSCQSCCLQNNAKIIRTGYLLLSRDGATQGSLGGNARTRGACRRSRPSCRSGGPRRRSGCRCRSC